jgi:4-amino-4-deoxy-L-arabinose transferase-like glycosyltransferase
MIAILGALLFTVVAVITILVAFGAPLGEFTMGGKHKVLPKEQRILAIISFVIQVFAIIIILQAGGFFAMWFSEKITKYICIFFAAYLSLNTIMNFFSNSKKERYFATPLSTLAAICFWITAFNI